MIVERIISFLVENIIFVFIVVAGLISFFKRAGNASNQNEEQPKTAPQRPPSKPLLQELFEVEEEPSTQQVDTSFDGSDHFEPMQPIPPSIPEEMVAYDGHVDVDEDEIVLLQPNQSRKSEQRQSSVSHKKTFRHPTKQQVTDGVIWAEILGPPRAKKPYKVRSRSY